MTREQLRAMLPEGTEDSAVTKILDALHEEIQPHRNAVDEKEKACGQLRAQLEQAQNALATHKKAQAIQEALAKYRPRDVGVLARLLDGERIAISEDGSLSGLQEQVEGLKASSAYLFADAPDDRGGNPDAGDAGGTVDMNQLLRG